MIPDTFPERLETPRFVVRAYRVGDEGLLNRSVNRSFEHLHPWMPWAKPDTSLEESAQVVRRFMAQWLLRQEFILGIFAPDESELWGGTGFMLRGTTPLEWRSTEIGMWISVEQSGQGLGTAVLKALLRWGFTDWGWERMEWFCDSRNHASARTASRAGMQREACLRGNCIDHLGYRRDTLIFGMLRSDWLGSPQD